MTSFGQQLQVTPAKNADAALTTAKALGIRMTDPPWPGALPTFWQRPHIAEFEGYDDSLRERPYATRGRDHETAHIAVKLQSMPKSINLIIGAPGSGKTALLENIVLYQRAKGCTIRRISPRNFDTNIELANAILGITDAAQGLPASEAKHLEGEVQAGFPATHARGAISTDETVNVDQNSVWFQAILEAGRRGSDAGTLFVMDEAQDLAKTHPDQEAKKWGRIQQFLQVMNSTILSGEMEKPPKVALLVSGLSNLWTVMNGFGMGRIENHSVVRMGPLSERAMQRILMDHTEAPTADGEILPQPPEHLLRELVEASGGNARHTAGAGLALQWQGQRIMADGRTEWTEADETEVRRLAKDSRTGLYDNRMPKNVTPAERESARVLAHATRTWGSQLHIEASQRVIETIAKRHGERPKDVEDELIRKGVLDQREKGDIFPGLDKTAPRQRHVAFPIHSMATYLNQQMDEDPRAEEQTAKANAIIEAEFGTDVEKHRIDPWHWDDAQKIEGLKSLPQLFTPPWEPPKDWWGRASAKIGQLKGAVTDAIKDSK